MSEFNKGKSLKIASGGYEKTVIEIIDVDIVLGKNCGVEYMMKNYPDEYFLRFKLKFDGYEHVEVQRLFLNDKGELTNMIRPGYISKDGEAKPATFTYDVWQAIKAFYVKNNKEDDLQELASVPGFSKDKFLFQKFEMGYKIATKQDGTEYIKLETDYQKMKDDEYKRKNEAKKASQNAINNSEDVPSPVEDDNNIDTSDLPF